MVGATRSVTTHGGSGYVDTDDQVEHVWNRGDQSAQFPLTPTRVEFRLEERGQIRRRSKNRVELDKQPGI